MYPIRGNQNRDRKGAATGTSRSLTVAVLIAAKRISQNNSFIGVPVETRSGLPVWSVTSAWGSMPRQW